MSRPREGTVLKNRGPYLLKTDILRGAERPMPLTRPSQDGALQLALSVTGVPVIDRSAFSAVVVMVNVMTMITLPVSQ
jgi:hypothetical protein